MRMPWLWIVTVAVALPLSQADAGAKETVLYSFTGTPGGGVGPAAGLADSFGDLYGTTMDGGVNDEGTVFKLRPPSAGTTAWTATVLHSFSGGADGEVPTAPLIFDGAGHLFGTTTNGGQNNTGTIFELIPPAAGKAAWTERVLFNFSAENRPVEQAALAEDLRGNLYSPAAPNDASCLTGCGVVVKLTKPATVDGQWKESTIYSFTSLANGSQPQGGVALDKAGNVYGTTQIGGSGSPFGYGVVFKLTPPGAGQTAWTETVLYRFKGGSDGDGPDASLVLDAAGNLYGTTVAGGLGSCSVLIFQKCGTVFKLAPPVAGKTAWTETVLHRFTGIDGANPQTGLTLDTAGNLYGTTVAGGTSKTSTVFKLAKPATGTGAWLETILARFPGTSDSTEFGLDAGVILDKSGNVYGTTLDGGKAAAGTVFELTQP